MVLPVIFLQCIIHAVVQFELQRTAPGDASEANPAVQQVDVRIDITPSTAILPERAEIQITIDPSSTATGKYVVTLHTVQTVSDV